MQAWAMDSSPVIDQPATLLGTVSKNKMNGSGWFRTRSKTEPLEHTSTETTPIASKTRRCGSGANNAQGKGRRSFVVTREKFLVGTINMKRLHRRKDGKRLEHLKYPAPESAHESGVRYRYSTPSNQRIHQKLK